MTRIKNYSIRALAVGRENNFNLLRFLAAAGVIFSHSFPISEGHPANEPLYALIGYTLGEVAVDVFFITSGFLVTRSLLEGKSLYRFTFARLLRIYPGLFIAVVACAFLLGLKFTTLPASTYLSSPEVWSFLFRNGTLLSFHIQQTLPGVFEGNPFAGVVNGSLWTLPWEMVMYLTLLIIGFGGTRKAMKMIAGVGLVAISAHLALSMFQGFGPLVMHKGCRLVAFFYMGGCCYLLRHRIVLRTWVAVLTLMGLFVLIRYRVSWVQLAYSVAIPYLALFAALRPSGRIRQFNRLGDYSYGLYVYAFPVQQSIVALTPGIGPQRLFLISLPVTLGLAIVSWHLVESPSLRYKDHYPIVGRGCKKAFHKMRGWFLSGAIAAEPTLRNDLGEK